MDGQRTEDTILLESTDLDLLLGSEYEKLADDELDLLGFDFDLDQEEIEQSAHSSQSDADSSKSSNFSTSLDILRAEDASQIVTKKRRRKDCIPLPKQKYVRRKPLRNVLYAFPPFDKSDSLLYLPVTLTRYLNTADFPKLARLLNSHLDKKCEIAINPKFPMINLQMLIKLYELMDELQPDRIMCVHHTKVVENQILATIYKKFIACKTIYDSVSRSTKRTECPTLCEIRKTMSCPQNHPSPVKTEELNRLLQAEDMVTVYSRVDLVITYDDVTKKVVHLRCTPILTSMHAGTADYSFPDNTIASSCMSVLEASSAAEDSR